MRKRIITSATTSNPKTAKVERLMFFDSKTVKPRRIAARLRFASKKKKNKSAKVSKAEKICARKKNAITIAMKRNSLTT